MREAAPGAVGDEQQLAVLFRAHYRRMVALAWLLVQSMPAAEDVVQEAFLNLQRAWPRVTEPVAYLRTVVVNGCKRVRRDRGREVVGAIAASPPLSLPAEIDDMLRVLAGLRPAQRTALVLRFYEDLADEDIARIMGCRPATVRSHVHRGLASLREVMGERVID
jgi:RNA polymerase sigma factor (sigma-70 family)